MCLNFFCQLIQNVNGSVLISTSDTTLLLLLTGYFDVLKTKLNTLKTKMAKISHNKIKQPSFGEKRPKLTYTKISRFTVSLITVIVSV
jgi:hypothetical protein